MDKKSMKKTIKKNEMLKGGLVENEFFYFGKNNSVKKIKYFLII